MLISTRGRYSLRVMLDLAEHGDEWVPLRDGAERQGISFKYAEAIVSILCKAGLVSGCRGKGGGYRLTRAPEEYTLGEILRLTEGSLAPVSCMKGEERCDQSGACPTLPLWRELDRLINGYLDGVTLRDLMEGRIPPAGADAGDE